MPHKQEEIKIDPERLIVVKGGELLDLPLTEMRVLNLFLNNKGKVLDRATIHACMFTGAKTTFSNIVDVYINYLRQKIGSDKIRTVRGQGYVFGEVTA